MEKRKKSSRTLAFCRTFEFTIAWKLYNISNDGYLVFYTVEHL